MVLCDSEISAALRNGLLVIDPEPEAERYTTSAVDLTAGDEFYRWSKASGADLAVPLDPGHPDHDYTTLARQNQERVPHEGDGSVILTPGSLFLCLTRERIELPIESRIAARVEGRSTLARYGVGVHVTAPTIHAGFRGRITLEITHQGGYPVRLRPGMPICQLIFEMLNGLPSSGMTGIFQDHRSVGGRDLG